MTDAPEDGWGQALTATVLADKLAGRRLEPPPGFDPYDVTGRPAQRSNVRPAQLDGIRPLHIRSPAA